MPLVGFGSNPGELQAWTYVPASLQKGAPLVVVLHGCTQDAASYDRSAGWSALAEELGIALLFPEQTRSNNPNLCFNWFSPRDTRRGCGEALSIAQMIEAMRERHGLDPKRVFVNGLSAGGAMTAVMLASYPDLFAGGAIIAGLPFGTAKNIPQALERMRGHDLPSPDQLADLVRSASDHLGPWPRLSVWHGTSDGTVAPVNAQAIVDQWRILQGLPTFPSKTESLSGHQRKVWADSDGRELIEETLCGGWLTGLLWIRAETVQRSPVLIC